jgi:hypothetical protein
VIPGRHGNCVMIGSAAPAPPIRLHGTCLLIWNNAGLVPVLPRGCHVPSVSPHCSGPVRLYCRCGGEERRAHHRLHRASARRIRRGAGAVPELAIGLSAGRPAAAPGFLADCERALQRVAAARGIVPWSAGRRRRRGGLQRGQRAARRRSPTYRKRELPNYAVFDERRYSAWIPMAARACSTWPACRSGW